MVAANEDCERVALSEQHLSLRSETVTKLDEHGVVTIALLGATGTGKSTFINLLTNDERIRIGHAPESETFSIQTAEYIDPGTGRKIVFVDVPGFDDSRDDVTDIDILEQIVRFLEPESGDRRKLNGIIYMHRISDPRVGGAARKNLRMFQALCGDGNLAHVRIVTTNWSRVSEQQGMERQEALERGAFKALLEAGAQARRHTNTVESAQRIVSDFIPLPPIAMQIQMELQDGKTLADTSAGIVLTAEIRELQQKHEKEMANLKREMEEAAEANDSALRAELEQERRALEEQMERAEIDQTRLQRTLEQARVDLVAEQKLLVDSRERIAQEAAVLEAQQAEMERETKQLQEAIQATQAQREEFERMEREERGSQDLLRMLAQERKDIEERRGKTEAALNERSTQERVVKELKAQVTALEKKCQELKRREREAIHSNRELVDHLNRDRRKRRSIDEKERRLRRKAEELSQTQKRLQREQEKIEQKKREIRRRARRGGFVFVREMGDVIVHCSRVGEETAGSLGAVIGGMVGVVVAPGVTMMNVVVRGRTHT